MRADLRGAPSEMLRALRYSGRDFLLVVVLGRVLLSVEDNDGDYYCIQTAVEECGFPVKLCRATDGDQALSFLLQKDGYEDAERPDLILLDIHLPKRNGFEVLASIRQSESLRSVPVVVFTSSRRASERRQASALGANDFVSKPNTLPELMEAVSSVCSRFLAHSHNCW